MKDFVKRIAITALAVCLVQLSIGQTAVIKGRIISAGKPVELANVEIVEALKKSGTVYYTLPDVAARGFYAH